MQVSDNDEETSPVVVVGLENEDQHMSKNDKEDLQILHEDELDDSVMVAVSIKDILND